MFFWGGGEAVNMALFWNSACWVCGGGEVKGGDWPVGLGVLSKEKTEDGCC